MVANNRKSSLWLWSVAAAAVFSLTGCSMYPTSPGHWPSGVWGDMLIFVSHVIDFFAKYLGGNYGVSLIVVTILVRLIILPLMIRQIRYQKVMQQMQPHIKRVREQHRGDAQKINEETMKLWQQHGVNPMAGCLPMVIQLPVLYALFGAIRGNVLLNKYTFLGIFQLGHPDPHYILPILAAITTYFSSRVMMMGQDAQSKMMLFIMPVMVMVIGIRFASGLALYWIVSNVFTAVQTYFIRVRPAAAVATQTSGPSVQAPKKSGSILKAVKPDTSSDKNNQKK